MSIKNHVLAGLIIFIAGSLFAQTPRELSFGTWVSGKLRAGEGQWYSVRSPQSGLIIVESSGDTDTYLEAYDSARVLIDENDDGGEGYNARLEVLADAGRTYLFKLKGYDDDESGLYQIRAVFSSIRDLPFGTWVSGTLRNDEEQWFSVRPLQAGHVIAETSGKTDTFLEAHESSGSAIASDDDSGEDYNARVEFFAEAGKTYRIKLRNYDDNGGSYQIRADFTPLPADIERNTDLSRALPVRLGEPFPVYLRSPSESRWFRYDIARNGTTFVAQTRGKMDTILVLYDAQGKQIEEDDDSGEDNNAMISRRLNAGTVYMEVKEYDGKTGYCTFHAEIR